MTAKPARPFRKRRLFPRSVDEVVKDATKGLMHKQGKLYSALLRDWAQIVGAERAHATRPDRLQFPSNEASGATLHILARPATAPELAYETEQMLEQCARYFGYRAVTRIVIHASHEFGPQAEEKRPQRNISATQKPADSLAIPSSTPHEIRSVLERIGRHVSPSDKAN